jgi:hypothetical protein
MGKLRISSHQGLDLPPENKLSGSFIFLFSPRAIMVARPEVKVAAPALVAPPPVAAAPS